MNIRSLSLFLIKTEKKKSKGKGINQKEIQSQEVEKVIKNG